MKILGLSCSPRKEGNTMLLLNEALQGAQQEGAEIELYSVAGKDLKPCEGCWKCANGKECPIKDDMAGLQEKMLAADGIIFGAPIYFYGMSSQTKTIIDRSIALNTPGKSLANKVGGVIVTAGSLGIVDALKDIYFYIVSRQMLPAHFVAAYPVSDLKQMEQCMKSTRDLGRQVALIAAMKFEYPKDIPRRSIGFGTHTR
ncbi:MAG: flavodoxin family protein [Dehalococcoidales bacterium]|nr:flavodoxin family protein [Dehalococcoidales bacterium]